jgi:hypothetical protein
LPENEDFSKKFTQRTRRKRDKNEEQRKERKKRLPVSMPWG